MHLSKIKRTFSIGIAAVLCFAVTLSVPAAAKTTDAVWKETKSLAGAGYSSTYIKLVEKYSEKDTTKTVTFSKSRTKKLLDKLEKASEKDEPQFIIKLTNNMEIVSAAVKGDKFKATGYVIGGDGMAYIGDSKNITLFDINDKEKCSLKISKASKYQIWFPNAGNVAESVMALFNFDISDNAKGKLFKFKSGEKIYYYEEFKDSNYGSAGFLFSESGNILAMTNQGDSFCVSVSFKVSDSEFNIPKDYKDVDYTDIDWIGLFILWYYVKNS